MSLYTVVRHPRTHLRSGHAPARASHEHAGFNGRFAAGITRKIGTMWTVYVCIVVTGAWMLLGSPGMFGFDPYPYPFLLFLGNVVQLLLIFIILLGQQVIGRRRHPAAHSSQRSSGLILVATGAPSECCYYESQPNHPDEQPPHTPPCWPRDGQSPEESPPSPSSAPSNKSAT